MSRIAVERRAQRRARKSRVWTDNGSARRAFFRKLRKANRQVNRGQ
jgi:hypothetical protein